MEEGGGYENPGFGERDPPVEHTDDRVNYGDTTTPFEPNGASIPVPGDIPMTTRTNLQSERGPRTAETSFTEGWPSGSGVFIQIF